MKSTCPDCGLDRIGSRGCTKRHIEIDNVVHPRMVGGYDAGKKFKKTIADLEKRCSDCGAYDGMTHHFGCENELCPIHKTPIISCDCDGAVATD